MRSAAPRFLSSLLTTTTAAASSRRVGRGEEIVEEGKLADAPLAREQGHARHLVSIRETRLQRVAVAGPILEQLPAIAHVCDELAQQPMHALLVGDHGVQQRRDGAMVLVQADVMIPVPGVVRTAHGAPTGVGCRSSLVAFQQ